MSPRATPMKPDARRRAIVEAVVPLLVREGGEVTTKQVAQAAGIAEGTIFRAFPDKLALWQAAAAHVTDPAEELAELRDVTAGVRDLRSLVVVLAEHLADRSHRVMSVVGVWRVAVLSQYRDGSRPVPRPDQPGAPQFLVDANRALMDGLTDLFAAHADEIEVPPRTAAVLMRTLAIGQRHPGAMEELMLTPSEIAEVMLHGIARRTSERESA